MPKTRFGQNLAGSSRSREQMRTDLAKIDEVPMNVLTDILKEVIKNYPCNIYEIAQREARAQGLPDGQNIFDVLAATAYIWRNCDGDQIEDIVSDLQELGIINDGTLGATQTLLQAAESCRAVSEVTAAYSRIGAPIFNDIDGTVSIRFRFHENLDDFTLAKKPTHIVDSRCVINANLQYSALDSEDRVLAFQMDENDLCTLKRFVETMETELSLVQAKLASLNKG